MNYQAGKNPGCFITFEGGEGGGKSTQIQMLVDRLSGLGRQVLVTKEPGATELGRRLEEILRSPDLEVPGERTELLLYLADRAQHVHMMIQPALEQGQVVICDRFVDSSEVYQGRARGLGAGRVRELNRWVCGEAWPDLTLLLDLDPAAGLGRVIKRQNSLGLELDRLESESMDFHRKVRQGFLDQAQAEPKRIKVVDASYEPEQVAGKIWALVEQRL